ncbi:MAG TPA: DsrE/DsrF/DrsH-like family protein [Thermoplasmata archaeon]|jgi:peroxiredoxin family protein|nr:DsrE/DsrF/DrsH-like family protein [Thermoplasmata archaeon]
MADKMVMVVSEGSFDKAMMPLIMGNTAASMGMEVHVFFTFFGLKLLKKGVKPKLNGMMRPFTGMIERKMKKLKIPGFAEMMAQARDLDVKLYACSTSMALMGVGKEELIDGVKILGASAFLDIAADSKVNLFIG